MVVAKSRPHFCPTLANVKFVLAKAAVEPVVSRGIDLSLTTAAPAPGRFLWMYGLIRGNDFRLFSSLCFIAAFH
jgi:hypothetical protein